MDRPRRRLHGATGGAIALGIDAAGWTTVPDHLIHDAFARQHGFRARCRRETHS